MKNIRKSIIFVAMLSAILLALTGCGSKKLVATKSTDQYGVKYEETIEVSFKNDKANEIVWTLDFDDESFAETYSSLYESVASEDGFKIERDGKKVVMTLDSEAFAKLQDGSDSDDSRDAVKKSLEDEGYTVK